MQHQDKKHLILTATEQLLATHGFERLSIQLVAKAAKVATGTIYRYFQDKDDLLTQLRIHVLRQCIEKIHSGITNNAPIKQKFWLLWRNAWELALSKNTILINKEQFDSLPFPKTAAQKAAEREILSPILAFFTYGANCGVFKALPCEVLSSIGLEPAICLARKQAKGDINLNATSLEAAIGACWDAIYLHRSEQS